MGGKLLYKVGVQVHFQHNKVIIDMVYNFHFTQSPSKFNKTNIISPCCDRKGEGGDTSLSHNIYDQFNKSYMDIMNRNHCFTVHPMALGYGARPNLRH